MHTYSPSAGNETSVALELSDKYELAGAEVSHGGYDPVSASGVGTDESMDVGADDGGDIGGGGGFGPVDVDAPEPQPATKKRTANAVAERRFIDAQTPCMRPWFHTVTLPSGGACAGSIIDRRERRFVDI
jgi:hypothetical protein